MKQLFFSLLLPIVFAQAGGQPITLPVPSPEVNSAGWQFDAGTVITQFNGVTVVDAGYDSGFSYTLPVPQMPVGIYTLTFNVENFFYWYPGQYSASVSLNSFYEAPLCSVSGHPLGDFTQLSVVCPVRDMYAQTLTVSFRDKGWQSGFKQVSLTFTPTN